MVDRYTETRGIITPMRSTDAAGMCAPGRDTFPTYSVVSGPLTVTEISVTDSLKGPLAVGEATLFGLQESSFRETRSTTLRSSTHMHSPLRDAVKSSNHLRVLLTSAREVFYSPFL